MRTVAVDDRGPDRRAPYAGRAILPPAANQVAATVKLSVIASFIAVPELLYTANLLITQTSRLLEFYTFVAIAYLALILPASLLARWTEARSGWRCPRERRRRRQGCRRAPTDPDGPGPDQAVRRPHRARRR